MQPDLRFVPAASWNSGDCPDPPSGTTAPRPCCRVAGPIPDTLDRVPQTGLLQVGSHGPRVDWKKGPETQLRESVQRGSVTLSCPNIGSALRRRLLPGLDRLTDTAFPERTLARPIADSATVRTGRRQIGICVDRRRKLSGRNRYRITVQNRGDQSCPVAAAGHYPKVMRGPFGTPQGRAQPCRLQALSLPGLFSPSRAFSLPRHILDDPKLLLALVSPPLPLSSELKRCR